ncbi:YeeE/YedE family protein [Vibrio sp. SS-MA-C1-2]|uniref:YeeE/YedE family protein n=1 Tax=Vibrio sp. SS-MA-C1-2 TaxID=2908646 RepID=UPI001F37D5B4|nr:YeeE/YedE thiosulfate transporter family protein [Vibrio sp. SS-MA-C1-2]UJF17468.1 YeeE/YedE family protein [Vibrio sp. SS-MA-C1-2]
MSFTFPWASLFGGILLGLSAVLLLWGNGKIAGISGILSGILPSKSAPQNDKAWRMLFLLGMILGGFIINQVTVMIDQGGLYSIPESYSGSTLLIAVAGLLVGIGTKLGNGCTSGHGICGMGRLSVRSMVATITFMIVAAITVFIRLHILN